MIIFVPFVYSAKWFIAVVYNYYCIYAIVLCFFRDFRQHDGQKLRTTKSVVVIVYLKNTKLSTLSSNIGCAACFLGVEKPANWTLLFSKSV